MIGRNWTSKSAVFRLSCLTPALFGMALPALGRLSHWSISLRAGFLMMILSIGWLGFVFWRVTMNAHKRGEFYGDIGS